MQHSAFILSTQKSRIWSYWRRLCSTWHLHWFNVFHNKIKLFWHCFTRIILRLMISEQWHWTRSSRISHWWWWWWYYCKYCSDLTMSEMVLTGLMRWDCFPGGVNIYSKHSLSKRSCKNLVRLLFQLRRTINMIYYCQRLSWYCTRTWSINYKKMQV